MAVHDSTYRLDFAVFGLFYLHNEHHPARTSVVPAVATASQPDARNLGNSSFVKVSLLGRAVEWSSVQSLPSFQ